MVDFPDIDIPMPDIPTPDMSSITDKIGDAFRSVWEGGLSSILETIFVKPFEWLVGLVGQAIAWVAVILVVVLFLRLIL